MLCLELAALCLLSSCAGGPAVPGEAKAMARNRAIDSYAAAQRLEEAGNYTAAIEAYRNAMQESQLYESARFKMARCCALLQDWSQAEELYVALLERDAHNLAVLQSLAYIYEKEGRLSESAALYERLVADNAQDVLLRKQYIRVLAEQGRYGEARSQLAQFMESFPSEVESANQLHELLEAADAR